MAFPLDPTNGEQTTQNGIVYIYNATLGVWAVLTNTAGNISAGNIVVTNSIASGTVSAVGNITGEYFVGNGSQLTGLPESYTNSNVAAYLPTYTGNLVSLTGAVTTTANVTGNFFIGDGSQLTGIDATSIQNGNSNVQVQANGTVNVSVTSTANVAVFSTTGVSVVGNITGGNITTGGTLSAVTIVESSSITLKENIRPIEHPLESILQLLGVMYDRKDGSTKNEIGLLAEDVYKIIPNIVSLDDKGNPAGVMYTKLSIYLLETIKKLHSEVEQLKRDR
jgi:hypothetical protein